ncbi:MAG: hypothetical protein WAK98_02235 [Gemmobacter sp.]
MKGWKILEASFRLLVNNLGAAFRVSVVPGVILLLLGIALLGAAYAISGGQPEDTPGVFVLAFLVLFAALATSVAVNWHRHVLLAEPVGWMPTLRWGRIGAYILRGILVTLIFVASGVVVMLPIGLLTGAHHGPGPLSVVLGAVALLFLVTVNWRLGAAMPGAALDGGAGIGDTWAATRGEWPAMLALALGFLLVSFLLGLLAALLAIVPVVGFAVQLAVNWFLGMLGLSILTTLYGHYIEKRPLV